MGGSFDPPTYGHIFGATEVLNGKYVDEIWLIPCGDRKDKALNASGTQRLEMVTAALNELIPKNFPLIVNNIEVEAGAAMYSYDLIKKLEEQNTDIDFRFVIGADILPTLSKWQYADKVKNEMKFLISPRQGYDIDAVYIPKHAKVIGSEALCKMSSTEARRRISASQANELQKTTTISPPSIKEPTSNTSSIINPEPSRTLQTSLVDKYLGCLGYVPTTVINYIIRNGLYGTNSTKHS